MKHTLQEVFQLGFKDYAAQHNLPLHYHKAANHIMSCRTAILGGHSVYCENHHLNGIWYNSCKHRACPQCSGIGLYRWVERQKERLLDCEHLHIIFPLAHEYLDYWRLNTLIFTNLMFLAAKEALTDLLVNDPQKKYLDAQPGFILALHTWGRDLRLHPHIHCIITYGGFTGHGWRTKKGSVLIPARVLRAKYQGKLNAFIRQAAQQDDWQHPDGKGYQQLVNLSNKAGRKKWNVFIKEHFKYAGPVLTYLVNYMRGGPLKNPQITSVDRQQVTFKYYPHQLNPDGKKENLAYCSKSLDDFFPLYLQHIPLPRKMMVRHYGLYANNNTKRLNQARKVLGQMPIQAKEQASIPNWIDYLGQIPQVQHKSQCRKCHQPLKVLKAMPRIPLKQLLEQVHGPR